MISAHIKAKLQSGTKLNVIVINQTSEMNTTFFMTPNRSEKFKLGSALIEKTLEQKVREAIECCMYYDENMDGVRSMVIDLDEATEKVMKIIEDQQCTPQNN